MNDSSLLIETFSEDILTLVQTSENPMLVASSASAADRQYSECSHHHNNQQDDDCDYDGNDADTEGASDADKHSEHCSSESNTMAMGVASMPNSTLRQTEKKI